MATGASSQDVPRETLLCCVPWIIRGVWERPQPPERWESYSSEQFWKPGVLALPAQKGWTNIMLCERSLQLGWKKASPHQHSVFLQLAGSCALQSGGCCVPPMHISSRQKKGTLNQAVHLGVAALPLCWPNLPCEIRNTAKGQAGCQTAIFYHLVPTTERVQLRGRFALCETGVHTVQATGCFIWTSAVWENSLPPITLFATGTEFPNWLLKSQMNVLQTSF